MRVAGSDSYHEALDAGARVEGLKLIIPVAAVEPLGTAIGIRADIADEGNYDIGERSSWLGLAKKVAKATGNRRALPLQPADVMPASQPAEWDDNEQPPPGYGPSVVLHRLADEPEAQDEREFEITHGMWTASQMQAEPEVVAQAQAHRMMDRLDVEEDDAIRGDLITDLQDMADAHPELKDEIRAYGIPVESAPEPTQPRPAHFRAPAKAFDAQGRHTGPGEWLTFIHAMNRAAKEANLPMLFGTPDSTGDWWAGGYVEEYFDARVLHRTDETVSIISKTDRGAHFMRLVAQANGWEV
jgi:hypothetical protein